MTIQINQELCSGCGICMDSCRSGAIIMDAQQVTIDLKLCNNCGVCIDACPNEAIAVVAGTTPIIHIPTPNPDKNPIMPIQPLSQQSEISRPLKENKPLTRAAMAFLESEIAPRLVTMAVSVLERKLTHSSPTTFKPEATKPLQNPTTKTRMKKMRIRSRGRSGMGRKLDHRCY
ncbi:MAG: 4Fe-4S binding protein [Chloroflexota bacterium]